MKALWIYALGIAALGIVASSASADLTLKMKETDVSDGGKEHVGTYYLGKAGLAYTLDGSAESGGLPVMIFRADKQVLWIIDAGKKQYMEMDKAKMDEMAGKMSEAMAKMQAELKNMPPEQRKMIEETMAKSPLMGGSADKGPAIQAKKTAESRKISGFDCTKYEMSLGGSPVCALWVASAASLGVSESDLAPVRDLAKMFESLSKQFPNAKQMASGGGLFQQGGMSLVDGFPVLTQRLDGDKVEGETLVESVTRGPIDSSVFELPAGLKKQEMMATH